MLFYFAVTHFFLLMSWPGCPCWTAASRPGCAVTIRHFPLPPRLSVPVPVPVPSLTSSPIPHCSHGQQIGMVSQASPLPTAPTPPPHRPPPLSDKDAPFPPHPGTGCCQNLPRLRAPRAPHHMASTAGLFSPQPHYPLSPHAFNKPHEQHLTTNLIQGSLPAQFICLTLRVAFPPAEVFIPLH